jgi:hypothetical protein
VAPIWSLLDAHPAKVSAATVAIAPRRQWI